MKNILTAAVLLLAALSQLAQPRQQGRSATQTKWRVDVIEKKTVYDLQKRLRVSYSDPEEQRAHLRDEASVQLWPAERLATALAKVAESGYILIDIEGPTIETANPRWFEAVITTEDGAELAREKGPDVIPMNLSAHKWFSGFSVALKNKPMAPLKVFVIDTVMNERVVYRLTPPGS